MKVYFTQLELSLLPKSEHDTDMEESATVGTAEP